MRLYLDEDVYQGVALGLRRRGFDVLTTVEAGRRGASDQEQLHFEDRCDRCRAVSRGGVRFRAAEARPQKNKTPNACEPAASKETAGSGGIALVAEAAGSVAGEARHGPRDQEYLRSQWS